MAQSEIVVHVRLVALTGIATCDVCSCLVSFRVLATQLERLEALGCPRCGGSLDPHEASVHPEVEMVSDAAAAAQWEGQ